jgi:hypothetical protein
VDFNALKSTPMKEMLMVVEVMPVVELAVGFLGPLAPDVSLDELLVAVWLVQAATSSAATAANKNVLHTALVIERSPS